jgi:hypothetical protein
VEPAVRAGMTWEATIARADHAVCLARCGQVEAAERAGQLAEIELSGEYDDYARAVVHDSLAELAGLLGRDAQARAHEQIAAQAWALDVAYCSGLRAALTAHGPLIP